MANRWVRGNVLVSIGAIWAFTTPLLVTAQPLLASLTAALLGGICYLIIRRGLRIPTSSPAQFGSIPFTLALFGGTLLTTYPVFGVGAAYLVLQDTNRLPASAAGAKDFSGTIAFIHAWQGKAVIGVELLAAIAMIIGLAYILPERVRLYDETHVRPMPSAYQEYCRQQGVAAISSGVLGIVLGGVLMLLGATALVGIFLFVGGLGALLAGFDWAGSWPAPVRHVATRAVAPVGAPGATPIKALVATVLAVIVVAVASLALPTVPAQFGPAVPLQNTRTPFSTFTLSPIKQVSSGFVITEFLLPNPASVPMGITLGPDGNLWFADSGGNQIGRISPAGVVSERPFSGPWAITAGSDGNLWFTALTQRKIARITPSGIITEFPLSVSFSLLAGIAAGPDGNLWFTDFHNNTIGRLNPSGTIMEYPLSAGNANPDGIVAGPDGNLWFTENGGNEIGRISAEGAVATFALLASNSKPLGIAAGPDGNLWFTESGRNAIGRISPSGALKEFSLHTRGDVPGEIAAGPDGNLWFTECQKDSSGHTSGGKLGRITPAGVLAEVVFANPVSCPAGIAAGSGGNLWFTDKGTISYLATSGAP